MGVPDATMVLTLSDDEDGAIIFGACTLH